jgi:hypothetical protein
MQVQAKIVELEAQLPPLKANEEAAWLALKEADELHKAVQNKWTASIVARVDVENKIKALSALDL